MIAQKEIPVFRFAPSPNGRLHLGHALSAVLNFQMADACHGRFLLRMEDIDLARCTGAFEQAIEEDLAWLGLAWEMPVRRQSDHIVDYENALNRLRALDLVYPAFMTRGEVRTFVAEFEKGGSVWPRDPDGSPHYPPVDKALRKSEQDRRIAQGNRHAWRFDFARAQAAFPQALDFTEEGAEHRGLVPVDASLWGDVLLWRSDAPSSYHLSVVVDDALQGVSHVVRGLDLFMATHIQRLLQHILGLPQPVYHHHRLVLGADGRKLSKSEKSTALSSLRDRGVSHQDVLMRLGG